MNWSEFGPALCAAWLGAAVSDALFFGLWGRGFRKAHPALWRSWPYRHQALAAVVSVLLTLSTCAVLVFLCGFLGLTSTTPALMFMLGGWLGIALPLEVGNGLALQLPTHLVLARALGWLSKLMICALAVIELL